MTCVRLAALLLPAALLAQQPEPRFEVVSLREVPKDGPPIYYPAGFSSVKPGGQFIDPCMYLSSMIGFAYNINASLYVEGVPSSLKQCWSVAAKPADGFPSLPPDQNTAQVRLMMRAMLADRFKLQLHEETRQGTVYKLELMKGGFKLQPVEAPVPPAKEAPVGFAFGADGGRMIGQKSTIAGIGAAISPWLKASVLNETGLTGYYDFDVKWTALEAGDSGQVPDAMGLVISALQTHFGLKLSKTQGPVRYLVVDHVEPPTEN